MEGLGRGKRRRTEDAVGGPPVVLDDNDEVQVEKFFALLRSVREMREQQRRADVDGGAAGTRPKVDVAVAWTPTFQWEDFAASGAGAGAATDTGCLEKKTNEEEEVDLRLSL